MADDPLRELLSSPIDSKSAPRRPADPGAPRAKGAALTGGGPWLVAAAILGAVIVFTGYRIADPGSSPTTTTTASTTTTTTAPDSGDAFPSGFVPVDAHYAMRVERILIRPDATFVTLSTVVSADALPGESTGFPAGQWELVLADGTHVASTVEGRDPLAYGFVSVRFEVGGIQPDDIVGLQLVGTGHFMSEVFGPIALPQVDLPEDGSPVPVPVEPAAFALDAGVELHVTSMQLSRSEGRLEWELAGADEAALAEVFPVLTLGGADGATETPQTRTGQSEFRFFLAFTGINPPTRSGSAIFDPDSPAGFVVSSPVGGSLDIDVSWTVFEPAQVDFPIEGVAVAVVG